MSCAKIAQVSQTGAPSAFGKGALFITESCGCSVKFRSPKAVPLYRYREAGGELSLSIAGAAGRYGRGLDRAFPTGTEPGTRRYCRKPRYECRWPVSVH